MILFWPLLLLVRTLSAIDASDIKPLQPFYALQPGPLNGDRNGGCNEARDRLRRAYTDAMHLALIGSNALESLVNNPCPNEKADPSGYEQWVKTAVMALSMFDISVDALKRTQQASVYSQLQEVKQEFDHIIKVNTGKAPAPGSKVNNFRVVCSIDIGKYIDPGQNNVRKMIQNYNPGMAYYSLPAVPPRFPSTVIARKLKDPNEPNRDYAEVLPEAQIMAINHRAFDETDDYWHLKTTLAEVSDQMFAVTKIVKGVQVTDEAKTAQLNSFPLVLSMVFLHELFHLTRYWVDEEVDISVYTDFPRAAVGVEPDQNVVLVYDYSLCKCLAEQKGFAVAKKNPDNYVIFSLAMYFHEYKFSGILGYSSRISPPKRPASPDTQQGGAGKRPPLNARSANTNSEEPMLDVIFNKSSIGLSKSSMNPEMPSL